MADYLINEETLISMGDNVRSHLNDPEPRYSPEEMSTALDGSIDYQTDLITQIQAAADSLPEIGSGGESEDITTETNVYTEKLASLETAITALETELQGKASGGSGGVIQTANVVTHTPYNSTLFYVGSNGITSISDQAYATVAMCIPSICFAKAPAAGFAATIYDGDCSMEFVDSRIAIFFVTGDASITVPGYISGPGDGA